MLQIDSTYTSLSTFVDVVNGPFSLSSRFSLSGVSTVHKGGVVATVDDAEGAMAPAGVLFLE